MLRHSRECFEVIHVGMGFPSRFCDIAPRETVIPMSARLVGEGYCTTQ
jgi:hypothetical protein